MGSDSIYQVALVAGMLAAFNPCGFALLPAYLTLVVAGDGSGGTPAAVGRALRMTLAVTVGFVAVFGGFGLVIVPAALSVEAALPWATVVIGVLLVGLGVWLASGRELLLRLPRFAGRAPEGSAWSMTLYGVAYAVASLSCTIAPFLALTTTTFRSSGLGSGIAAFAAYGLGMGLVVGVLAVAVALGREAVVRGARRVLPLVTRISGVLLVLAGAYVTYYGIYELRVNAGGDPRDPVVGAVLEAQGALARFFGELGAGWVAVALVTLIVVGVGGTVATRALRRGRAGAAPHL